MVIFHSCVKLPEDFLRYTHLHKPLLGMVTLALDHIGPTSSQNGQITTFFQGGDNKQTEGAGALKPLVIILHVYSICTFASQFGIPIFSPFRFRHYLIASFYGCVPVPSGLNLVQNPGWGRFRLQRELRAYTLKII